MEEWRSVRPCLAHDGGGVAQQRGRRALGGAGGARRAQRWQPRCMD